MSSKELNLLRLARSGDFSGLHLFLEQNVDVELNFQGEDGVNALIACVQGSSKQSAQETCLDHISCGSYLVESGININAQDSQGRTALHWAVLHQNQRFVEVLLESRADTSIHDSSGQSVIHLALSTKAYGCLETICGHVSTEALEQSNRDGVCPLSYAVQLADTSAIQTLLDCGAPIDLQNVHDRGKTAAHYAAELPDGAPVLGLLLRYGADTQIQTTEGCSVLFLASSQANPSCLSVLVDKMLAIKGDLNQATQDSITPLMIASKNGLTDNVKILLSNGADPTLQDETGKTALHFAVERKKADLIRLFLTEYPSLGKLPDKDGRVPLQLAIFDGSEDMVDLLIPCSDLEAKDNEGHSCIHWATACGWANLIETLAEAGANVESVDIHGARPLHYAAKLCSTSVSHQGLECLMALLKRKVNVDCLDNGGKSPLLWAAGLGADEGCKLLLNAGANVMAKDEDGLTALHYATSCNHPTFMELLVRDFNCPPNVVDGKGRTPLYYAVKKDLKEALKALLKHGGDPSWQDENGNSPVHQAASSGSRYHLQCLHQYGGLLESVNNKGEFTIHEAAKGAHVDILEYLLERGCKVNVTDEAGRTPLHLAATSGSPLMCSKLIDAGADVNAVYQNEKGYPITALDCALTKSGDCSQLLQLKGAKKGEDIYLPIIQVDEQVDDDIDSSHFKLKAKASDVEKETDNRKKKGNGKMLESQKNKENTIPDENLTSFNQNSLSMMEVIPNQNNNNSKGSSSEAGSSEEPPERTRDGDEDERVGSESKSTGDADGAENILARISNWSHYVKEQTALFDPLLSTDSPELAEHRQYALQKKNELIEDLKKMKEKHDARCQKAVEDFKTKQTKNNSKDTESFYSRAVEAIKRLQRVQSASIKSDRKQKKSVSGRSGRRSKSQSVADEIDGDDSRQSRHEYWLIKKNKEYARKKNSVRPKSCPRLDPEVVAATIGMKAMWQDSHEQKMRRVLSVTRNRPQNVPEYIKSPYSNRTTGECGLYKAYSTKDTNEFYNLHGTVVAERHRERGLELNKQIYPKSWQLQDAEAEVHEDDRQEEIIDLKAYYSPRWDGKVRPRNTLRFHSGRNRSSSSQLH